MRSYTKQQIEKLGLRPRFHLKGLLPCELRECKAVTKELVKSDELWQFWRLIPFEEGYACQRRKLFEEWIKDEVESLWYDIGEPIFDEVGDWHCDGGWWPYLDKRYIDMSYLVVGKAVIDMDEVYTTLRNQLQEKIHGYRMCPGMMLYRIVKKISDLEETASFKRGDKKAVKELEDLKNAAFGVVKDYPTEHTKNVPDREWYNY